MAREEPVTAMLDEAMDELENRRGDDSYQHGTDATPGCGAHRCDIRKPKGQGNNGRCRCSELNLRLALRRRNKQVQVYESALQRIRQQLKSAEQARDLKAIELMESQEKCNALEIALQKWRRAHGVRP